VVEAILMHPDLYDGPRDGQAAGRLHSPACCARSARHRHRRLVWLCDLAGQQLFYPPNVSGWDDSRWLDTSTCAGAGTIASTTRSTRLASTRGTDLRPTEDPDTARARAARVLGQPALTDDDTRALLDFAQRRACPADADGLAAGPYRAMRQNALRQLIATSPDYQTC
jgi:hypothetical protein